jgi:hypothetical protein
VSVVTLQIMHACRHCCALVCDSTNMQHVAELPHKCGYYYDNFDANTVQRHRDCNYTTLNASTAPLTDIV